MARDPLDLSGWELPDTYDASLLPDVPTGPPAAGTPCGLAALGSADRWALLAAVALVLIGLRT